MSSQGVVGMGMAWWVIILLTCMGGTGDVPADVAGEKRHVSGKGLSPGNEHPWGKG